jgi:hypothetical protein
MQHMTSQAVYVTNTNFTSTNFELESRRQDEKSVSGEGVGAEYTEFTNENLHLHNLTTY